VDRASGTPRPDATCWAIVALNCAHAQEPLIQSARRCLASIQSGDGRVCITPKHPEACWPTSPAILAWQGAPEQQEFQAKAVRFLLEYSEVLAPKARGDIIGYDTTLKGWSWMVKTFSWVEPTALAMIALRAAGYKDHPRVQEAVALLMDRQLPDGGWNIGSPMVLARCSARCRRIPAWPCRRYPAWFRGRTSRRAFDTFPPAWGGCIRRSRSAGLSWALAPGKKGFRSGTKW